MYLTWPSTFKFVNAKWTSAATRRSSEVEQGAARAGSRVHEDAPASRAAALRSMTHRRQLCVLRLGGGCEEEGKEK